MKKCIERGMETRAWIGALLLSGAVGFSAYGRGGISESKHNLSTSGLGNVRAAGETHICIFCHTPHSSNPAAPHWNRPSLGSVYTPYRSSTAKATIGQPTGSSKLCLSCHDGTVALGMLISRAPVEFAGGMQKMPKGRSNLETDLTDDHPISFVYDSALVMQNGELNHPVGLGSDVKLDGDGMMQCTSCHNPHSDEFGNFLVKDNTASALCITCHDKNYWNGSEHQISPAGWSGSGLDPWPYSERETVSENACGSCHTSHDAGSNERLLYYEEEEQNCFACHNGNVAEHNIEREFQKISTHPVYATTGVHDPAEDKVNPPRHVECSDCHNPHAVRPQNAEAPFASGALSGVAGVSSEGTVLDPLNNEYELCYRCHADSIDRGTSDIIRMVPQTNTRLEFSASNTSYHPVETIGRNPDVPGLISPYTESSIIYCTDCHNSDASPGAGGSGPDGPHGSVYEPLLERYLRTVDGEMEGPAEHALCYKCHDRDTLLNPAIGFPLHELHLNGSSGAACTTCHDSHGSTLPHLINFNTDYVKPLNGVLEYNTSGPSAGNCTLSCHGSDHSSAGYE